MSEDTLVSMHTPAQSTDPLSELVRSGARELISKAIEAELRELLSEYEDKTTRDGRRLVVRNGYQPSREVMTGIGSVEVTAPKVRSRGKESVVFHSALVPPYIRRSRSLNAAIPWLYLKGISTGQMQSALEALVGEPARNVSPNYVPQRSLYRKGFD